MLPVTHNFFVVTQKFARPHLAPSRSGSKLLKRNLVTDILLVRHSQNSATPARYRSLLLAIYLRPKSNLK